MPDRFKTFTTRYSAEIALVARHCPAGAELDCLGGSSLAIVGILPGGLRVEVSNPLMDHDGDGEKFVSVLHDPDGDQLAWIDDGPLPDQLAVVAAITTEQARILRQHNAGNPGRSVVLTTRAHTTVIDPADAMLTIADLGAGHRISISHGQGDTHQSYLDLTATQLDQLVEALARRLTVT